MIRSGRVQVFRLESEGDVFSCISYSNPGHGTGVSENDLLDLDDEISFGQLETSMEDHHEEFDGFLISIILSNRECLCELPLCLSHVGVISSLGQSHKGSGPWGSARSFEAPVAKGVAPSASKHLVHRTY